MRIQPLAVGKGVGNRRGGPRAAGPSRPRFKPLAQERVLKTSGSSCVLGSEKTRPCLPAGNLRPVRFRPEQRLGATAALQQRLERGGPVQERRVSRVQSLSGLRRAPPTAAPRTPLWTSRPCSVPARAGRMDQARPSLRSAGLWKLASRYHRRKGVKASVSPQCGGSARPPHPDFFLLRRLGAGASNGGRERDPPSGFSDGTREGLEGQLGAGAGRGPRRGGGQRRGGRGAAELL